MQTERVTFLATPKDKAFLARRAAEEGISVGEFVRRRALQDEPELTSEQSAELKALVDQVNELVPDMLRMMDETSERMQHSHEEVTRLFAEMDAR